MNTQTLIIIIAVVIVLAVVLYFALKKKPAAAPQQDTAPANNEFTAMAGGILSAVGGKPNVTAVDCCATRLRFELADTSIVDDAAVKAAGGMGVVKPNKTSCQIFIGTRVPQVYAELKKML